MIKNGTLVSHDDHPTVGAIVLASDSGNHPRCTGTALGPNTVLTAAHCFFYNGQRISNTSLRFALGPDIDHPTQIFEVANVQIHPDYLSDNLSDIALIELTTPLSLTTYSSLGTYPEDSHPEVKIVGYGLNENELAGVKRLGTARVIHNTPSEIWTSASEGTPEQITCPGDSGGPAFLSLDGEDKIVGISHAGNTETCAARTIALHVSMENFSTWILSKITEVKKKQLIHQILPVIFAALED